MNCHIKLEGILDISQGQAYSFAFAVTYKSPRAAAVTSITPAPADGQRNKPLFLHPHGELLYSSSSA